MRIIEQLAGYHFDEHWLVESHGQTRCLWVSKNRHHLDDSTFRELLGEIHPRISAIYSLTPYHSPAHHIQITLIEVDDDRGPTLVEAAAQLTDPLEREHWVVSQIIAIAEGLEALRERNPKYVYPSLYPERFFIDETGHARLRSPMPRVMQQTSRTGGADLNAVRFLAPEQVTASSFEPGQLSPGSEVFALAVNLYTAITGRRPFAMDNSMNEMMRIMQGAYDPIALYTPNLGGVIDFALSKNPIERFGSPRALARELRGYVPDAGDYDTVTSDRIAIWRANLQPEPFGPPTVRREDLERFLG